MTNSRPAEQKALSLREAFDQSFVEAVAGERPDELDFLEVRVAGDPYALRVSEVQSLHASRRIVAAPSQLPELLGMSGFRGVLTPVYDLARLLGYGAEPAAKWLVVARNSSPIAFAFGGFESHLRVVLDRVSAAALDSSGAVRGAVQRGGTALPLLHLPSLVAGIAQRIKAFGSTQEQ
ncbi:MAG: chemotaxis protein CheW [Pseudomonadota bacterium]